MRRCLDCGTTYTAIQSRCPACHREPEVRDGMRAYAPALVEQGGGFKPESFANLARLEPENFWFRARNRLIVWAIEKYCPHARSFLEIGCGTGFVLSGIADAYPDLKLSGSEIFLAGLKVAAQRNPQVDFFQMDARDIPFIEEFDAIGVFDVLEHIEEDERVLSQVRRALNPGGFLLLTVPQHDWLWSPVDEYACHVRRYSAKELHRKLEASGFEILRSTSFVSTLLPAMVVSRTFQKHRSDEIFDPTGELRISPWLNSLFGGMLRAELGAIRMGLNIPLGGSRLVVARRTLSPSTDQENSVS